MSLTTVVWTGTAGSNKSASWLVAAVAGSGLLIARCAGDAPPSVLFTYEARTPWPGTLPIAILPLIGQNGCRAGLDPVGLDTSGRCLLLVVIHPPTSDVPPSAFGTDIDGAGRKGSHQVDVAVTLDSPPEAQSDVPYRLAETSGSISPGTRLVAHAVTPWHIVVHTTRPRVVAYFDGRPVRVFKAIVGKPSTPTPRGEFFVEEAVRLSSGEAGAPYALALSARSDVLQEFAGGPGQIALHGIANIGGVLGTDVSHGCVRLSTGAISWLGTRIGTGVPVTITP